LKTIAKNPRVSTPKRDGTVDRSSETISRLQRGILRLALAYHGQNVDLDAKLKQLGVLIRNGQRDSGLQQLIDEIVDTIVSLDIDIGKGAQPAAGPAATGDALEHFFERLELPAALVADIEAVRRLLAEKRDSVAVLHALERAATILNADLGRGAATEEALRGARRLLLELTERIPTSRALVGEATVIKRTLEGCHDLAALRPCAKAIGDLVIRVRDEVQHELDRLVEYLRGTARRLQEFEQFMNRSRDSQADAERDALQLSETLTGEVVFLREEVTQADDLETLKRNVDERLSGIDRSLHTFMLTQNRRAVEARDAIENMAVKLKDLEQEAESLRDDLEEQHARILVDPLTGVLNRAGYTEMAGKQYARWKRYGGSLSLAVIDLDLFKEINDRYGHSAGDKVLATVAAKLQEQIRQSDVLCRVGGEEFVLVLPETAAADAAILLEKLRAHIEQCPFRHKDTPVRVTMSCGVAQFRGSDSVEEVFERADQAMYRAKSSGRNRVCSEDGGEAPLQRSA